MHVMRDRDRMLCRVRVRVRATPPPHYLPPRRIQLDNAEVIESRERRNTEMDLQVQAPREVDLPPLSPNAVPKPVMQAEEVATSFLIPHA